MRAAHALLGIAATPAPAPAVPQGFKPVGYLRSDEFDGHVFEPIDGTWPFDQLLFSLSTSPEPVQEVTLTDRQFDLICQAIDKADTITMEGDYMMDSDDCIGVVRVMQALFSIAALREKEQA